MVPDPFHGTTQIVMGDHGAWKRLIAVKRG
jgi:hypothetical protein